MADNDSFKIGKRQQARQQKRKHRIIVAIICLLIAVFISLCVVLAVYLNRNTNQEKPAETTPAVTETVEPTESEPAVTDTVEPTETPVDTALPEETTAAETESAAPTESKPAESQAGNNSSSNQSGTKNNDSGSKNSSGNGSSSSKKTSNSGSSGSKNNTANNSSSGNKSNSSTNGGSTNNTNKSSNTNNGSTSNNGGNTTAAETLKSATLTSPVDSVTQGASGTLSCTVTSSSGSNITAKSTIVYTGTGCTISGNQVTFDQVGTAQIYATITYNGASINTNTISITVTKPALASATLSSSVSTATVGGTGTLTISAKDARGNDVSGSCSVAYTVTNCTVSGNTVTFTADGTATITAAVTYEGKTINTEAVSVTVAKAPIASASISGLPSKTTKGETANLSVSALDTNGKDISQACTVTYSGTGCTVEGTTATFDTAGTATITATVTYEGKTITTEAASVTVTNQVLTSLEVNTTPETAEKDSTLTLTAQAKDQDGAVISSIPVTFAGKNCTVKDGTVTFDQAGTATITATATQGETVLTKEITVKVIHTVTLTIDGEETKVDLTDLSQKVKDETYGWSVSLPELLKKDTGEDAKENTYTCADMGDFTIQFSAANLAEDDTATIRAHYNQRLAEVKALEGVTLRSSAYSATEKTYHITWKIGDTVYSESFYLGKASSTTVTASWNEKSFSNGKDLLNYILDTYKAGDLSKAH